MQFTFADIVKAIITLAILGIFTYGVFTGVAINERFTDLMLAIVAYWFGLNQVIDVVGRAVVRKRNNSYPENFKG